ncbi:OLC1v1016495C1 [Oldenlandia corymbosa var. corymbosa]|uniref:Diphthine--ammonia ligase n=1 Tax=Oldenlandia corymbosa var. corymbosa TaxID=529605 RepID=A0AAV1E5H5_OLDCO|nr:OLC1v1016495C1 [Oldenlandia corymbosa var. corymbosa]
MKVVALVSGGKDSCYAMMKCLQYGHEIVALANLLPADDALDELNSYMYQTVGHQIVVSYAKCMGLPLFRRRIQGSTRHHGLSYSITPGDEVEDLFILLSEVKRKIPSVTAVSSGAIASDYQRLRVESVCSRLGLVSLAYLWKLNQSLLLQEMIKNGIMAITVKVAVMGLDPEKHLGKELSSLEHHLHKLNELYGVNICGEGGEYETLTLDCPLFKNARVVLDEYQVVLHSTNPISPVGILHPSKFHLEQKMENGISLEVSDLVYEVLGGNCPQSCETMSMLSDGSSILVKADNQKIEISKTKKDNTLSLSCWLQNLSGASTGLQTDLELVLTKIELELTECGYSWENLLYIHLYIADMNKFSEANETYVRFITQNKCRFGVPSRSTVELPLSKIGLGLAYMEVLVAADTMKTVLHVQSISGWAPSCIGPYSQATLHKGILYMAGQLGLDPPTMSLCTGGATSELEQALKNSQAVADCFNCSISTSTLLFVMYCSETLVTSDLISVEERAKIFLEEMKINGSDTKSSSLVVDPLFLYILVPDLPKRALVEVKPILYVPGDVETSTDQVVVTIVSSQSSWGFKHESWHSECVQKCVIPGRLCTAILSVSQTQAVKICSTLPHLDLTDKSITEDLMDGIAKFCIYVLDSVLLEAYFSWDDVKSFRIYVRADVNISHTTLSLIYNRVFSEFAELNTTRRTTNDQIFNIIPVLGSGRSARCVDNILTCEIFARKA